MAEPAPGEVAAAPEGVVTFVGIAHPWMCDAMGHLNVRHYAAMFDDASFQLLGRIAGATTAEGRTGLGWADVRLEIDFLREIPAGAMLTVTSTVERIGNTSISYRHVMSGSMDGRVHAQARVVTLRFDLQARAKVALDPQARSNAAALAGGTATSP